MLMQKSRIHFARNASNREFERGIEKRKKQTTYHFELPRLNQAVEPILGARPSLPARRDPSSRQGHEELLELDQFDARLSQKLK